MKILVADDDPLASSQLEACCRSILRGRLNAIEIAASYADAMHRLSSGEFDAFLLDPQLQDQRGLDLMSPRLAARPPTIVVSGRTDLAVRAFESGVVDFVPKPFSAARLATALQRIRPRNGTHAPAPSFLAVHRLGRIELVPVEDLVYAEGADKYSELVLADGRRDLYDRCLSRLEESLPSAFVRIHKSFLVRFAEVVRIHVQRGSKYFAELRNGQRLPVGRTRYREVKARLL